MTFKPLSRACVLTLVLFTAVVSLVAQSDQTDRIREATTVFREIMSAPDKAIPTSVLQRAEGIAIFPSTIKGGFIVGGHRGKGILSVRSQPSGAWSPPAFLTLTGASFGAQIGGQAVDVILVIMNRRGLEHLLQNQFKIGAGAAVTAGPLGRDAEAATDIQLRAEILSYSRARGLFAGVTLTGSAIREDRDSNADFYGRLLRTREIVLDGKSPAPPAADVVNAWFDVLKAHVPNRSN